MSHVAVPNDLPFWRRLLTLEPALIRGVIVAAVSIGLIWGVDFSNIGEQLTKTADILGAILPLVTAWWIRGSVTPAARVVQEVTPGGTVVAGEASPLATGTPIKRATILPVDPPA